MANQTNPTEFRQKYNVSEALLEIISNEHRIQTIIEDIKADRHIHIDITRFIYDTDFYKCLETRLQNLRNELAGIEDYGIRLEKGKGITELEEEAKRYKIDILTTASTLYKVRNTEKIDITKHYFFKGEIKNAYESLQAQDLGNAQETLLSILKTQEKLEEVYEKLVDNANEYLIKAELTSLNLDIENPENRFQKTIEFFEKGKISAERSKKENFVSEYYFDYAVFLQKHKQFKEATNLYQATLLLRRKLSVENPNRYLHYLANVLNNLAILFNHQKEFQGAKDAFDEAIEIRRKLYLQEPKIHLPFIANILNNLAILLFDNIQFEQSSTKFQEALEIYRKLAIQSPKEYLSYLGSVLNNFANFLKTQQQFEEAKKIYEESLDIYQNLSLQNADRYLPCVATTLNNLAILLKGEGKFLEAGKAFQKALEIRRKLAQHNPSTYLPYVATTLNNLAILLKSQKQFQQAKEVLEEALVIRKSLSLNNPNVYLPYVATTLNNLAVVLLESKVNFQDAKERFIETLDLQSKVYPIFETKS